MDGVMATLGRSNGVGTTRIVWSGLESVVLSLPICLTDWMNGRKVDDVEAHVSDRGQAAHDIIERAVTMNVAALRSGKEFVPAGELRVLRLRIDCDRFVETALERARISGCVDFRSLFGEEDGEPM